MSHDVLRDEHERLQRAVQASRRSPSSAALTPFVREMQKVMDDYRDARAAGMAREDAVRGIEEALRSSGAFRTSKFSASCDDCDDSGWARRYCCYDRRCGREVCAQGHPSAEHPYVVACDCPKGDVKAGRSRAQQLDEIGEAMKIRKPKRSGFSRW